MTGTCLSPSRGELYRKLCIYIKVSSLVKCLVFLPSEFIAGVLGAFLESCECHFILM